MHIVEALVFAVAARFRVAGEGWPVVVIRSHRHRGEESDEAENYEEWFEAHGADESWLGRQLVSWWMCIGLLLARKLVWKKVA